MTQIKNILIIGSTGRIGRYVVDEAVKQGFNVQALVRNIERAHLNPAAHLIQGDLTKPLTLDPVDAVIFTQGSYNNQMAELVDYNGVKNVLIALNGQIKKIVLMTSLYAASVRDNSKWKRRAERLVRASNIPYTIIRPGWFDTNQANEKSLLLTQNNQNNPYTFTALDGGVSRFQIAETLVLSLKATNAINRTVELIATKGKSTNDFDKLFKETVTDVNNHNFDAIYDPINFPLEKEPNYIRQDLDNIRND